MVTPPSARGYRSFVVGGGPAGFAAALAARKRGLQVIVADRARPPIDKACGEGLMPDGVAALREFGVELTAGDGLPFRGIRFLDGELQAEARFPNSECGFRHPQNAPARDPLVRAAEQAGADLWWQSPVEALEEGCVTAGGRRVRCRWIAGADGAFSRVREWCGLQPAWYTERRIGLRQHFRTEPWTNFVEVYWSQNCQAYVTPVGPDEICVALLGTGKEVGVEELPSVFPKLAARLAGATRSGPARGGVSMSMRLDAVTKGSVALLGDASGTVDAITGEGLHLAFRQADARGGIRRRRSHPLWRRPSPVAKNAAAHGAPAASLGWKATLAARGIPVCLQRPPRFSTACWPFTSAPTVRFFP